MSIVMNAMAGRVVVVVAAAVAVADAVDEDDDDDYYYSLLRSEVHGHEIVVDVTLIRMFLVKLFLHQRFHHTSMCLLDVHRMEWFVVMTWMYSSCQWPKSMRVCTSGVVV